MESTISFGLHVLELCGTKEREQMEWNHLLWGGENAFMCD